MNKLEIKTQKALTENKNIPRSISTKGIFWISLGFCIIAVIGAYFCNCYQMLQTPELIRMELEKTAHGMIRHSESDEPLCETGKGIHGNSLIITGSEAETQYNYYNEERVTN